MLLMINELEKFLDIFEKTYGLGDRHKYSIFIKGEILKVLDTEPFDWKHVIEISKSTVEAKGKTANVFRSVYRITTLFLYHLIDSGLYEGIYLEELLINRDNIILFSSCAIADKIDLFFEYCSSPISLVRATFRKEARNTYFIVTNINLYKRSILYSYIESRNEAQRGSLQKTLFTDLINIVYEREINCSEDFNDDLVEQTINTILITKLDKKTRALLLSNLLSFVIYLQETGIGTFDKYNSCAIKYDKFVTHIGEGYKLVKYSPYDNPPEDDLLMLDPSHLKNYSDSRLDKIVTVDFTKCDNEYLRKCIKACFWQDTTLLSGRYKSYTSVFEFCEFISQKDDFKKIEMWDIFKYKSLMIRNGVTVRNLSRKLIKIKYFLTYCNSHKLLSVNSMAFNALKYRDERSEGYKEAYTKDEIHDLLAAYEKECDIDNQDRSIMRLLYYYLLKIYVHNNIRVASLLSIRTNSLVKVLNNKKGEWKLLIHSKTNNTEDETYFITNKTKEMLDEVANITSKYRDIATGIECDFIFLYKRTNSRGYSVINQNSWGKYHKNICEKYDIRYLPLEAIRNFYSQIVNEYVEKNLNGDINFEEKLNQRTRQVTMRNYDKVDITQFCQEYYNVEIGKTPLKVTIGNDIDLPESRTAQVGHCSSECCVGSIDCRVCKHLVITKRDIPRIEKEIDDLNLRIQAEMIKHERDFLISIKKLDVKILEALYRLEVENVNN